MDKIFEFDGNKYKEASSHQKEWGNKIISEFNFNGVERILELGCGDGVLTKQLSEFVPNEHVLGIDSSQGMIKPVSSLANSPSGKRNIQLKVRTHLIYTIYDKHQDEKIILSFIIFNPFLFCYWYGKSIRAS